MKVNYEGEEVGKNDRYGKINPEHYVIFEERDC